MDFPCMTGTDRTAYMSKQTQAMHCTHYFQISNSLDLKTQLIVGYSNGKSRVSSTPEVYSAARSWWQVGMWRLASAGSCVAPLLL